MVTLAAMEKLGIQPKDTSVVVQGFGNVGSVSAQLLAERGCKIIGLSDVSTACVNQKGIDVNEAIKWVQKHRLLRGFTKAEHMKAEEFLELPCDVLVPAAREEQITAENAVRIKAKIICEGANGPTTASADPILRDKGIMVIPDILANAGGVTVSYFEWVQDRIGYFWTLDRVNRRLERMMRQAFESVYETSQKYKVTLRIAAYVIAIDKVAKTLKVRGIYG